MHKIFVQRKTAQLNFPGGKTATSALPDFLEPVTLGGIPCVYPNRGANSLNEGVYEFEITTLVLTSMVKPVTITGNTFVKGQIYEDDIVELYLIHIASQGAAGVRTPAQWHNCINPTGAGLTYTGKWGCPIIITRPPANQMIVHHVGGVYKYGMDVQGNDLTTLFDHYLIQMILPNQTLCYYAVPNTAAGEAHILSIQNQINQAAAGVPLAVGAQSEMRFYDDLQMWIFDEAIFVF